MRATRCSQSLLGGLKKIPARGERAGTANAALGLQEGARATPGQLIILKRSECGRGLLHGDNNDAYKDHYRR